MLAHTKLDGASGWIIAVKEITAKLEVTGVLFKVNALHCQKAWKAAQANGNALFARIKGNQAHRLTRRKHSSQTQKAEDQDETVVRSQHGWPEHRSVETFDVAGQLVSGWDSSIIKAASDSAQLGCRSPPQSSGANAP